MDIMEIIAQVNMCAGLASVILALFALALSNEGKKAWAFSYAVSAALLCVSMGGGSMMALDSAFGLFDSIPWWGIALIYFSLSAAWLAALFATKALIRAVARKAGAPWAM